MDQNAQGRGDEVGTFASYIRSKLHPYCCCLSGKKREWPCSFSCFYDYDYLIFRTVDNLLFINIALYAEDIVKSKFTAD